MTLYKGEWVFEESNPTTIKIPRFKQGDLIVFTNFYKTNIILDNNDTALTTSGNLVTNFTSYCKGWEFIADDSL
jgi:co-chaperonin GroES (HSP10)